MIGTEPTNGDIKDFVGTKIALVNKDRVLAILREDKPGLDFSGMWDLPGGAREGHETPIQTVIREVNEELGLYITPEEIVWQKVFPAVLNPSRKALFMVVNITDEQLDAVIFGDEGREWKMMPFEEFINHQNAVTGMQTRVRDYLERTDR